MFYSEWFFEYSFSKTRKFKWLQRNVENNSTCMKLFYKFLCIIQMPIFKIKNSSSLEMNVKSSFRIFTEHYNGKDV